MLLTGHTLTGAMGQEHMPRSCVEEHREALLGRTYREPGALMDSPTRSNTTSLVASAPETKAPLGRSKSKYVYHCISLRDVNKKVQISR